jgi:hypothetical protein
MGNLSVAASGLSISLREKAGWLASGSRAAIGIGMETDPCSHVAAVIEAATTAAATIGAGAAIMAQRSPWSRGAVPVDRATTVAPSGAVVTFAPAAIAAPMLLLLLAIW